EVELTATDNCDGDITVGPTSVTTEGACANDFTIVRTWTFVDICGNTSSVSQTITVKDETAPVAPNPPANVTVSCASDVPAEVELTATDNCDGDITVGPTSVTTEGACANDFEIVRTWTFVDICGNTSSVSQTITVKDEIAPVAPNPLADVRVSCASDVPAEVELTATDNCDGDITVGPTSVTTEGACANDFTIVRTWTFVDICGNTSSVSQTITVKDETAPVAPNPPADVTVSCASDVPAEVELTATDNCDGDITVGPTSVTTEGTCANDFTIVRTWTFVDICGNTSSVSQTITVKDETAPVAPNPPANVTVSCASDVPAEVELTATDNCDGDITVGPTSVTTEGTCANDFTIVRTWTFVDICGNTSSVSQTITVKDEIAPVAPNPPADVRVSCASDVPAEVELTATDNCDGDITVGPTSVTTEGACANDFEIVRTWTFVDICGNTSSVSQTITVKDEIAPVAPNPPADVRVSCASDVPAEVELTATDNCDGDITVGPTSVTTEGACANDFTIVRTWTFVDICGNTSSVSQTITVKDETAPVAPNPPADVRVSCASDVPAEVELTATDNCDGDITVGPTSVTTEGVCANDFTIVRTWTFVDICGNTSSVSQTITVKDETAPAAPEPPANVMVSCASDVPAEVELTATDNCDGDITVGPTSVTTEGACANDFTIVRTWTFVDICGNTSSVSQTITVKDETAPVAPNPPADVTVSCASDVPAEVELTATDNCDGDITVGPTSVTTEGACANDFTIVRTWTFVDICGNTSSVSQTITVKDETAPVAPNPPADVTVSCASDVPAEVELTATDNCDGDITVGPTSVTTEGACANDFTIVRTWTFVDICGNTSSISQTITVKDETAPVAPEPPANVTVSCASDVPAEVELTATDNCDGDITVGPTSVTTEGACANDFTIVRTWIFVDICGNTSSVSQTITVKDETAPAAPEPPANVTVSCASDVPAEVELKATDNCDGDITVGPTSVTTEGACANDFTIVRTWTFVDICGNTSSVSQTITVKDETAPVAPNPPANVTVSCASDVPAEVELTATDNCDGDITVGPTSVTTEGACANDFTIVRTWTFVDICGNTSSVSQTITVKDEIAPVAPNPPADVSVSCASDVPAEVELTATDNCDGDITVGPTSVTTEGACANDFTIVRTWTFVDICGNTSSVSQTITVKDEIAPVAPNPPGDVRVSCASDVPAEVELTATDNCDGDITVGPTSVTTEGACANDFTIVRTWTFVDICGNTSSVSQTITVKDETAPTTPEPPADITVSCVTEIPEAGDLTAWDECSGEITVSPLEAISAPGACANDLTVIRTWVFVDECGNSSEVSQTITVKDETPPVLGLPLGLSNLACVDDIPPAEEVMALVIENVVDECLSGIPTVEMIDDTGAPQCIGGIFARTYSFEVCDPCGNCATYQMTYSGNCAEFCTLTQGGWGNAGGKYPWPDEDGKATTTEIITALMEYYGDIVIGDPLVRSLIIEDPECVLALLPGGGPSGVLPEGNNVANDLNDCVPFSAIHLNKQGRLRNNLVAQTIALQLNVWYSSLAKGTDLGGLNGGGACLPLNWSNLPETVVTVQDLLDYTNLYLSGQGPLDKSLAAYLTEVVSGINEYFDGCSLPAVFEEGAVVGEPGTGEPEEEPETEGETCVTFCAPDHIAWDSGEFYAWGAGQASTADIAAALMAKYGDIVLGDPGVRSLTIKDPECVMTLMPATGGATVLPGGDVVARSSGGCIVYEKKFQNKNGRLKNALATQTIVLQLNIWYVQEVYGVGLGDQLLGSACLPVSKERLLPSISSVQDLLDYANVVLSGQVGSDYTNLYLTGQIPVDYDLPLELANAITAVNAYLKSCGQDTGGTYQSNALTDLSADEQEGLHWVARSISLRPNPAHDRVEIRYSTELEGNVQLRITDLRGSLVHQASPAVHKGINSIRLNTSDFGSGLFIVSIMQDSELLQQKLVIVRN
ncbi:HYR-like domain-containing protein, partial [Flavilitoribacter nigricans]